MDEGIRLVMAQRWVPMADILLKKLDPSMELTLDMALVTSPPDVTKTGSKDYHYDTTSANFRARKGHSPESPLSFPLHAPKRVLALPLPVNCSDQAQVSNSISALLLHTNFTSPHHPIHRKRDWRLRCTTTVRWPQRWQGFICQLEKMIAQSSAWGSKHYWDRGLVPWPTGCMGCAACRLLNSWQEETSVD